MFESFVIMLREGIEAALVIGIILTVLKRTQRRDLERPVFWGLGFAILASIGASIVLNLLPIGEEVYEGGLYWVSALFVVSMMWWMHRKSKTLRSEIEGRVEHAVKATTDGRDLKEICALGAFVFLMVFREGAEAVMFLSAVTLTTGAMLSFIGSILGLAATVVFCIMFVRGSLRVNLRRFFVTTEWILGIFVIQLIINGYHEFSEAGIIPATQRSMSLVGPIVRNNSLFIIALIALPMFIWLSKERHKEQSIDKASDAERRLIKAKANRERNYRYGAVISTLAVLVFVGIVYAREVEPKGVPPAEDVSIKDDAAVCPLQRLEDGRLHHFQLPIEGKMVRFLAMKTSDGKYRTALDACNICGTFGYVQKGKNLLCLNCSAEISPLTLGNSGGCNPVPLESTVTVDQLYIPLKVLEKESSPFTAQSKIEAIDLVCGLHIKINETASEAYYEGKTCHFCSKRCHAMLKVDI